MESDDLFKVKFNIFGENKTFELWLKSDLSPVKKRKGEENTRENKGHRELNDREIDKIGWWKRKCRQTTMELSPSRFDGGAQLHSYQAVRFLTSAAPR